MWFYIIDSLLILAVLFTIIFTIVRRKSSNMKTSMFATLISVYSVILVLLIGSLIGFHFLFQDYQYVQTVADAAETKPAVEKEKVGNLIGNGIDDVRKPIEDGEQSNEQDESTEEDEIEEVKKPEAPKKEDTNSNNEVAVEEPKEKIKGRYTDFANSYISEMSNMTNSSDLVTEFELKGEAYKNNIPRLLEVEKEWVSLEEEIYRYLKNTLNDNDFVEMYGFYGALLTDIETDYKLKCSQLKEDESDDESKKAIKILNSIIHREKICKYLIDYVDIYELETKPDTKSVIKKYFNSKYNSIDTYESEALDTAETQLEITIATNESYIKWFGLNNQLKSYNDGLLVYEDSSEYLKQEKLFIEEMEREAKIKSSEYLGGSSYNSVYNSTCSDILREKVLKDINNIK